MPPVPAPGIEPGLPSWEGALGATRAQPRPQKQQSLLPKKSNLSNMSIADTETTTQKKRSTDDGQMYPPVGTHIYESSRTIRR